MLYRIFLKYPNISTDSRNLTDKSIFFALKGKKFNGNKFAEKALKKCQYAVIDEEIYKKNDRYMLVDNVLNTLQRLASLHRKQLDIPIIAITGTNGKTTTKELTAKVLSKKYNVIATKGNLNNHIGVPLTLLGIDDSAELGIIEMGANHIGEIARLCRIAMPDYGLITNIGMAHLEGFGSIEVITAEKASIFLGLKAGGQFLINGDYQPLVDYCKGKGWGFTTFGTDTACDIRACDMSTSGFAGSMKIEGKVVVVAMLDGEPERFLKIDRIRDVKTVDMGASQPAYVFVDTAVSVIGMAEHLRRRPGGIEIVFRSGSM